MTLFLFSNDALLTFSEVPSISFFLYYIQKCCSITKRKGCTISNLANRFYYFKKWKKYVA
jgi:hypothetical protein